MKGEKDEKQKGNKKEKEQRGLKPSSLE